MTSTDAFVFVREPLNQDASFNLPEFPDTQQMTAMSGANIWRIRTEDADALAATYLAAGWGKATVHPTREHASFEAAREFNIDEFHAPEHSPYPGEPVLVKAADLRAGDAFHSRYSTVPRNHTITSVRTGSDGTVSIHWHFGHQRLAAGDVRSVVNR